MEKKNCYVCGRKVVLNKNVIGLNKKLLGRKIAHFYCLNCLAEYLEVTPEELLAKIEEFKVQGCKLFE
jgi:hypothetical protein